MPSNIKHQEHIDHHQMMMEDFKRRFWICLVASVPVLILSHMVQSLLNIHFTVSFQEWILLGISTFIYFYGGKPFLTGMVQEIKTNKLGMMTLVGLSISIAYVYSSAVAFGLRGTLFFEELVTLIDVMLLGHWIEMRSVMNASKAIEKLAELLPSYAHLIEPSGSIKDVKTTDLKKGDSILVRPGEKIAADGIVTDGQSTVNESALTGEATPIFKEQGAKVIGGSLNENGSLTIEIQKDQKESYITQVIDLVNKVMESKSGAQDLADKAAFVLTIIALVGGFFTFIVWLLFSHEISIALERMVSVMVIACPHALGLAIPLVVAVVTSLAAKTGLLIRNRKSFEEARNIDMVVFDKTGTLTQGKLEVTDIVSLGKLSKDEILSLAASLENHAQHSIAIAIVSKAKKENITISKADKVTTVPGKGVYGKIGNEVILVGTYSFLLDKGFTEEQLHDAYNKLRQITQQGKTAIFLATANVEGIIAASDTIRDEAYEACKSLKDRGIKLAMITGDNKFNADAVAKKLGIDVVLAEVLPDQKAIEIKKLQHSGLKVAMVGDGINDAPALATADIGIAIGAGTDIAIETADIILIKSDVRKITEVIDLSRATHRKIIQNLWWATGYNIVALPLAAGILYKYGIMINPAVGALLMSLSAVIVAINSRFIGK